MTEEEQGVPPLLIDIAQNARNIAPPPYTVGLVLTQTENCCYLVQNVLMASAVTSTNIGRYSPVLASVVCLTSIGSTPTAPGDWDSHTPDCAEFSKCFREVRGRICINFSSRGLKKYISAHWYGSRILYYFFACRPLGEFRPYNTKCTKYHENDTNGQHLGCPVLIAASTSLRTSPTHLSSGLPAPIGPPPLYSWAILHSNHKASLVYILYYSFSEGG